MKTFKFLLIIIGIVLIPLLTFLLFLYTQDRLVILYRKTNEKTEIPFSSYQEKLTGIFITETEEKKIPFSISFDTFDKNHPENFIHTLLYQFFHYINLENIGNMNYDLYHVALNNKSIIINGSLHQTKALSPLNEYLFLKSIFITITKIFPFIESVYFYTDEQPLKLQYVLPFFTKEMINEELSTTVKSPNNAILSKHQLYLIPFFEGNGNQIEGIFEKNLFQKNQTAFFLPKNKNGTTKYYQEINQYKSTEPSKIIVYLTIKQAEEEHLDIVSYPVIPEEEYIYELTSYPLRQNNDIINSLVSRFKKEFPSITHYSFPFIPIINTIYPALYITISIKSISDVENILYRIQNIHLNS
jgi:hypothetical protein